MFTQRYSGNNKRPARTSQTANWINIPYDIFLLCSAVDIQVSKVTTSTFKNVSKGIYESHKLSKNSFYHIWFQFKR